MEELLRTIGSKKKIQNVFIETLPVNRVYIIDEHRVFSFELPLEFVNFEDTTVMCDLARCLGYSARPFWNTRRMLGDFSIANACGTKLLQSSWYWSFCGSSVFATEYPNDFCSESVSSDPMSFKSKQLSEATKGNQVWSRSLIDIPIFQNPWAKIPHLEYHQCYRYSQSLFAALLRINEQGEDRYLQVDITTVVPTTYGTTFQYFEYWATDYNHSDILRLKRLMNSIQIYQSLDHFKIYGDLIVDTEQFKIEQKFILTPEEVLAMGKKIVRNR